jgi:TatD DNase family protein
MTIPYINIHTHNNCDDGAICIRNRFVDAEKPSEGMNTFFSLGLHPWYLKDPDTVNRELALLSECIGMPECLAIGETGLDKISETDFDLQVQAFEKQLHIAAEHNKPVIIHCVKAWDEMLQIRKGLKTATPWIIHGFSSSYQMASQLIDHGCMLSFGNHLPKRHKLAEVFKKIRSENFFLETDDEPLAIEIIYEHAKNIRDCSIVELKQNQLENFERIFTHTSLQIH